MAVFWFTVIFVCLVNGEVEACSGRRLNRSILQSVIAIPAVSLYHGYRIRGITIEFFSFLQ